MALPPYLPDTDGDEEDREGVFSNTLGRDLLALKTNRRQAAMELIVTVAGSLLIAELCALILLKW